MSRYEYCDTPTEYLCGINLKEANREDEHIQFQKGMRQNQFLAKYGVEQQCEAALEDARWPEGFRCPKCSTKEHYQYRRGTVKIFQCRGCSTQTTISEGTIFHSTKLSLTIWFQVMYLLTQTKYNVSTLELRRLIGISYPAAWMIKHKLMQVMCEQEK